jgi:hypothetical protein
MGREGSTKPRIIVVKMTVAEPLPAAKVVGLTAHVVAVAAGGREQDKLTCVENPF